MWLTLAVSAVLGALSLLLTARLDWSALTPEELLSALGQVLAAATLAYKLLKGE